MYRIEGEPLTKCPYDPNHIIRVHRLPYHIQKCKKNHREMKLQNCVYNFSHLIKNEDFLNHIEMCPNKSRIESACYNDESLEHESCKNEYEESEEHDCSEDGFYLIPQLRNSFNISEEEKSDHVALQGRVNVTVPAKEFEPNLEVSEEEIEEEAFPPLQLPKTTSKAFQIKKSLSTTSSTSSEIQSRNSAIISKGIVSIHVSLLIMAAAVKQFLFWLANQ